MRRLLIILLLVISAKLSAQINLLIEGVDSTTTTHNGYEITRASQTNLIFRYNKISTALDDGFMLMAGDNDYNANATKLDGAQIYGNSFISTNTTPSGSLHAAMVGYNRNYDIHHNYVESYVYGVTHEGGHTDHTSMTSTSGGIYYNIFKNITLSINDKGFDGTRIVNNTFYSDKESWGAYITLCNSNTGGFTEPYPPTKNVTIKNNIFYVGGTYAYHAIYIVNEADTLGLECDYNIYFYEHTTNNEPLFSYKGANLTWTQWRALGYDEHSIIVDPNFIDFNDFVPTTRLDYGTPITGFENGFSSDYELVVGEAPSLTAQSGTWQVGAVIYEAPPSLTAYYVSTTGSDSNDGSFASPWLTWQYAFTNTPAGDTCYFRDGVYHSNVTVTLIGKNATRAEPTCFFAYPGETPIIDFSTKPEPATHNYGVRVSNSTYLKFKGLTGRNVYQFDNDSYCVGIWDVTNSNNITFEQCTGYNAGGGVFQVSTTDTISYINCDAYNANDPYTTYDPGGGGFGFNWSQESQTGYITLKGCRAWNVSDVGFGGSNEGYVSLDSCWSMYNGFYLTNTDGVNGSGFKLGLNITDPIDGLSLVVKYCIAAFNKAIGFTPNDNNDHNRQMHIYNNFIYHNGIDHGASSTVKYGFFFTNKSDSTGTWNNWIRNNISYNNYNKSNVGDYYTNSPYINHENNYWLNNPTVTDEDFVSLDTTGMMGPRQSNGNLPFTTFGHLAEGSNLIDAGTTNTGLPYSGIAPDVGPFEYYQYVLKQLFIGNKPAVKNGQYIYKLIEQ